MKHLVRTLGAGAVLLGSMILPASWHQAHAATAAAAPDRCHTGRLYITTSGGDAGVGHVGLIFRIRSLAQQTCTLFGYPGAQLVDPNGRDLPTKLQWGGGYLFGSPSKKVVTLAPGASAYFKVEWVHIPSPGDTCPVAGFLLVTPPDERTTIVVPVQGVDACGGRITATPMLEAAV